MLGVPLCTLTNKMSITTSVQQTPFEQSHYCAHPHSLCYITRKTVHGYYMCDCTSYIYIEQVPKVPPYFLLHILTPKKCTHLQVRAHLPLLWFQWTGNFPGAYTHCWLYWVKFLIHRFLFILQCTVWTRDWTHFT